MEIRYNRYLLTALFVVFLFLSYLLIKPFLLSILTGLFLAYVFYPLYKKLNKWVKNKNLSAFVMSILIILLITVPVYFMFVAVNKEINIIYLVGQQKISAASLMSDNCPEGNFLCENIKDSSYYIRLIYYADESLEKMRSWVDERTTTFLFSLPGRILDIIITIVLMFFIFRDTDVFIRKTKEFLSLKRHQEEPLLKQTSDTVFAVIYGNVVIAIIEGVLGGLGFWAVGIASPVLWGVMMTLLALIPIIGAGLVYIPAAIILMFTGSVGAGIFILLYGIILISGIDFLVKPLVIGRRSNIHPIVILLGVLGGIALLGPIGVVYGPLILALLFSFFQIYKSEST